MGSRVLHIIDNMCLGGAQRIAITLVENESTHSVHALRNSEASFDEIEDLTATQASSRFNIRSFLDLWRLLNERDPEIVHCHLIKSKTAGIVLKALSRNDFKLVLHEHGQIWKENEIYNQIMKFGDRFVDYHVAVSEHTAELLKGKANISDDKIKVMYNFVDRKKFNPSALKSFESRLPVNIGENSFVVGFGGRLVDRKGWRTFASTAEYFEEDVEFLISGSGNGEDELKRIEEETDNLHYLGFLDDIRILFSNIDCLILPSFWDPSPMILYEALSCGIPIICADSHSIDELIEDRKNGLMFDPGDRSELIERIEELRNDDDLQDILRSEGKRFAEDHMYETYQKQLEKAYNEI